MYLAAGDARPGSVNRLVDRVMTLPGDRRFVIDIIEYREPLPDNYFPRLKIPVRQLARFHHISYEEMNEIVHDNYYPKRIKKVAGIEYEVSVPTNKLTEQEARKIEADLHILAGTIGCRLTWSQDKNGGDQ